MNQKPGVRPSSPPAAKVVVFGVDDDCKPHAAWFPKAEADRARSIAKQLRLNVIEVINGTAAEVIAKLPTGRIHANGPGAVPTIREDLYEKVVATLNSRGEAGREPGETIAIDAPGSWDAIKPGHVVLVCDSLVEGWWAAIVVGRTGDKVSVRWRDYPGYPKFTIPVTAIALSNPTPSNA
jgi:hypothetical protein